MTLYVAEAHIKQDRGEPTRLFNKMQPRDAQVFRAAMELMWGQVDGIYWEVLFVVKRRLSSINIVLKEHGRTAYPDAMIQANCPYARAGWVVAGDYHFDGAPDREYAVVGYEKIDGGYDVVFKVGNGQKVSIDLYGL